MNKTKVMTMMLEPTWISQETEDLGKFGFRTRKLMEAPSIYDVVTGKRQLTLYFQNEGDDTKYYVSLGAWKGTYILLTEDGLVYTTNEDNHGTKEINLCGMYMRTRGAPKKTKAKGGFVLFGDGWIGGKNNTWQTGTRGSRIQAIELGRHLGRGCYGESDEDYDYDERQELEEELAGKYILTTLSFRCLARFMGPDLKDANTVELKDLLLPMLQSGRVHMVDATPDTRKNIPVNKDEYKIVKAAYSNNTMTGPKAPAVITDNSPGRGYVPDGYDGRDGVNDVYGVICYHRSGGALMGDSVKHRQFVFGVDEDSYFGSELPKGEKYTKVHSALLGLAPVEAREHPNRKVSDLKYGVERQGEWFLIPTMGMGEIFHPLTHPVETVQMKEFVLTKDDVDSADHVVVAEEYGHIPSSVQKSLTREERGIGYRHTAWLHLPTQTQWLQRGTIEHSRGEHADLTVGFINDSLKNAYQIVENRAVASFSEAGVD